MLLLARRNMSTENLVNHPDVSHVPPSLNVTKPRNSRACKHQLATQRTNVSRCPVARIMSPLNYSWSTWLLKSLTRCLTVHWTWWMDRARLTPVIISTSQETRQIVPAQIDTVKVKFAEKDWRGRKIKFKKVRGGVEKKKKQTGLRRTGRWGVGAQTRKT